MANKKEAPTDAFMQFKEFKLTAPSDTSTLKEEKVPTGLSVRGQLAYLIHLVQVWPHNLSPNFKFWTWALCSVEGLSAMPQVSDKGVVAKGEQRLVIAGAAYATHIVGPMAQSFLPPVPFAAPNLSLYWQGAANHADGSGDYYARIGFTTAPMDSAMVLEVAETWGY